MKLLIGKKRFTFCIALLFLLYFAGPLTLRQATGSPFSMELIYRAIFFSAIAYLLYLYFLFCDPVTGHWAKLVLTGLPFVLIVLIGGVSLYNSLPSVRAQRILTSAEFARLPESANKIKILVWTTPMSGERYLKFGANPTDIKEFLDRSPIIDRSEYEEYSDKRMRLFFSERSTQSLSSRNGHEYFNRMPTAPPWYMQEIRNTARRYRIRPKGYNHYGELIVDEKNNLVFIKLVLG